MQLKWVIPLEIVKRRLAAVPSGDTEMVRAGGRVVSDLPFPHEFL